MMKRIGILGGMFDPVHVGHTRVALAAQQALHLDQVRMVPCSVPNHRGRALGSSQQRLDMLRLAVSGHPALVVDEREINRPGTSYTYDTLITLHEEFQDSALFFIVGIDAFASLDQWHRWRDLFDLCHFVVIERPGFAGLGDGELEKEVRQRRASASSELNAKKSGLIFEMEGLDSPVSSSMVRASIAADEPLDHLLDPAVATYLEYHQLYRKAVSDHQKINEWQGK